MAKIKNKEEFPSYSLILDEDSQIHLSTFLKMYQIYYSIDKAFLFENDIYRNHFVRLVIDKDENVFPWLEFMMYEIVDLVNNLHTIADGVYTTSIKHSDFLKNLNFDLFWEQMEDWAEYITLEDFKEGDTPNIEYIFKLYKCTDHWFTAHGQFPKVHKELLTDLYVDIDEYYATYIDKAPEKKPKLAEELAEEGNEINAGVIPMTAGPNIGPKGTSLETKPNGEDLVPDTPPEDEPEPEPEKERSIKADIVIPKMEEHGIHSAE